MDLDETDIEAIVDALDELTSDGPLEEFQVCKEGKLVFAAYQNGRQTVLDSRVLLPRLMGAILDRLRTGRLQMPMDASGSGVQVRRPVDAGRPVRAGGQ